MNEKGTLTERDKVVLHVVLDWYYGMARLKQKELATMEEVVALGNRTVHETDELMVRVVSALKDFEMR